MDLKVAKAVAGSGLGLGFEIEVREDYSGRGMIGEETAGLVGLLGDIMFAAISLGCELNPNTEEGEDSIECLLDSFSNLRTDSMGRDDTIIY